MLEYITHSQNLQTGRTVNAEDIAKAVSRRSGLKVTVNEVVTYLEPLKKSCEVMTHLFDGLSYWVPELPTGQEHIAQDGDLDHAEALLWRRKVLRRNVGTVQEMLQSVDEHVVDETTIRRVVEEIQAVFSLRL
mmetsp:Transcript_7692/g.12223  ORF Transcript_7692/g.12223 Transcript_7692/m.12223 type:complete len:133 (-) Transcript_7692:136-534(-)